MRRSRRSRTRIDGYRFNEVAQALYDFFWGDYCDWFVEAAKTDIFAEDPARKAAVLAVMDHVLSAVLRLLHPFMPHITEELWALLGFGEGSIQFAAPPQMQAWLERGLRAGAGRRRFITRCGRAEICARNRGCRRTRRCRLFCGRREAGWRKRLRRWRGC